MAWTCNLAETLGVAAVKVLRECAAGIGTFRVVFRRRAGVRAASAIGAMMCEGDLRIEGDEDGDDTGRCYPIAALVTLSVLFIPN